MDPESGSGPPQSGEHGKTYPLSILLGPQRFARTPRSLIEPQILQSSWGGSEEAEKRVRDIRRATRRQYSAEEKIRIVIAGLRGEDG